MPSMSMPSMSMPSMSMPDMKNVKLPKRKERNESGPYGCIIFSGSKIKRSGKSFTISNAKQYRVFKGETENKEGMTFNLTAENETQCKEWYESIAYAGGSERE
jgi:hypothetical protein